MKTPNNVNILVTICARGGSKGVSDKNIRKLRNKPLIAYTIEIAKKWGKADKIVCSTDSERISKVAKEYGAEIPFMRSEDLAKDDTGKIPVIRDALIRSEKIYSKKFDIVIDLDATSPIRTTEDLDRCMRLFKETSADVVITCTESRKSPYFNMVEINEQGFAELSKKHSKDPLRRQDAPKVYDMNASIYFYRREKLLDEEFNHPLSSEKVSVYVMDDVSAFDIDKETDFVFVEFIMDKLLSERE